MVDRFACHCSECGTRWTTEVKGEICPMCGSHLVTWMPKVLSPDHFDLDPGYLAFDLDGCLVNTDAMHYVALNAALESFNFRPISEQEHLTTYKGLPTATKLEMRNVPASMMAEVWETKQELTADAIVKTCTPDPTKTHLLSTLREMGYKMSICSNCIRESVDLICKTAGLIEYVEFTLSTGEVDKPKPDPEMYCLAASIFGIGPPEMIVIEDGAAGKKAALDAGCKLIAVDGPHQVNVDELVLRIVFAEGKGRTLARV